MHLQRSISLRNSLLVGIILIAALSRLIPHPYNFTPIGAIGLFGGAYFANRWQAWVIPFAAMWVSDLVINNLIYAPQYPALYPNFVWWGSTWVYASFALITALGVFLLKKVSGPRLLGASLASSLLFFLVTNFGSWLGSSVYGQNLAGLVSCYVAGIPFFWNTLAGDLTYTIALFGVFEFIQRRIPAIQYVR